LIPIPPDDEANPLYDRVGLQQALLGDGASALTTPYVGIALTPSESFESGLCVMNHQQHIMQLDKFTTDDLPLDVLAAMDRPVLLALDLPKNIMVAGKYNMERLRMHFTLPSQRTETGRYADRLTPFLQALFAMQTVPVVFVGAQVKQVWNILPPFRSRSQAYCRQLHATIRQQLGVATCPAQVPAAAVLDSMVASMVAWSVLHGTPGVHYTLTPAGQYPGLSDDVWFYTALQPVALVKKPKFKRYHVQY
jgi:hypothetical protein